MPDGFVEITRHRVVAEELHLEPGAAEEGSHDPGNLGADKKVADQPDEKCLGAVPGSGGEVAEVT